MSNSTRRDPFQEVRSGEGVLQCPFHGESITMILRHGNVRQAAKDWRKTQQIEVLEAVDQLEQEEKFTRKVGFEKLRLRLRPTLRAAERMAHESWLNCSATAS